VSVVAGALKAVLLALLSGWVVLRLGGADLRWPSRVIDLVPTADGLARTERRRRVPIARHRADRRTRPQVRAGDVAARDLPATIDMLRLAVTAGHTLHTAIVTVSRSGAGAGCRALALAVDGFERGGVLVDEVERLPDRVGGWIRPLSTTLVVAARSGSPVAGTLQRLADAERRATRRRTEERIRRLPVLLLIPLVGLILPAFVLMTVVPVALTTARSGSITVPASPFPPPADPPRSQS
jgi:pilus assembly protein TadC